MNKNTLFIFLSLNLFGFSGLASEYHQRVEAYVLQNGSVVKPNRLLFEAIAEEEFKIVFWNYDFPQPTEDQLPTSEQATQILSDYATAKEAARQAAKPLEQRQYENAFFELTEQVLTLSQDERAGQTPPVKLGFDELNALLESLFDTDMANATKLSIRLLSIDSALKRYNTLWWEDAIQHVLPEE